MGGSSGVGSSRRGIDSWSPVFNTNRELWLDRLVGTVSLLLKVQAGGQKPIEPEREEQKGEDPSRKTEVFSVLFDSVPRLTLAVDNGSGIPLWYPTISNGRFVCWGIKSSTFSKLWAGTLGLTPQTRSPRHSSEWYVGDLPGSRYTESK